jgi:quercetin dioxygenase-like cupin family protein
MQPVSFDEAETYEPDEGWRRVSLAGSDRFTFEWFEKPPGHSSPMHDHENEQVCLVLQGEMTVYTEDDAVTLGP